MLITTQLYPEEYMRILRIRLEMTQSQLAKRLGVHRKTINCYENSINKIPPGMLAQLIAMGQEESNG